MAQRAETQLDLFSQNTPNPEKREVSGKEAIEEIVAKVGFCILRVVTRLKIPLETPKIDFSLKGASAGQCKYEYSNKRAHSFVLRFNLPLALANFEDYTENIVPHEVAHMVVATKWGKRAKSHGEEWQRVMARCFNLEPSRCHSYDVSNHARRLQRPYVYACGCREFHLTAILHKRIQEGSQRACRKCKGMLVFVRESS